MVVHPSLSFHALRSLPPAGLGQRDVLTHKPGLAPFALQRFGGRHGRIQEHAAELPADIDIALLSLAYHHMPWDDKATHLREMSGKVNHLLLMEMDGDNDTSQLGSPELAVSVYQSYGPLIDAIFAHDAPITVTQSCVDNFVMAEVISFLTQPRGRRNDYHMLRGQWTRIFSENLDGHHPRGEATVLTSDGCEFFACHWSR